MILHLMLCALTMFFRMLASTRISTNENTIEAKTHVATLGMFAIGPTVLSNPRAEEVALLAAWLLEGD